MGGTGPAAQCPSSWPGICSQLATLTSRWSSAGTSRSTRSSDTTTATFPASTPWSESPLPAPLTPASTPRSTSLPLVDATQVCVSGTCARALTSTLSLGTRAQSRQYAASRRTRRSSRAAWTVLSSELRVASKADSRLWDLAAGKAMTTLTHHKKAVRSIAIHPSEYSFASGSSGSNKCVFPLFLH